MVITEVRIKLCEENSERLLAFCSVTFDNAFVVRDLKIIEGAKGLFVAMPSRKLADRCPKCGGKNHLRARYCNNCGARLDENRALRLTEGRAKLHADIAHPIHSAAREQIHNAVIQAYYEEKEKAKQPGYVCTYDLDDYDLDDTPVTYTSVAAELSKTVQAHPGHSPVRGTHFTTTPLPAKTPTAGNQEANRSNG
ncbi:MAG: SpoVG family protein [Gemmataceae bacterium]|nr:SpoVG family protein [Gemmataceae bacterium]MCS7270466.1 SpoVG family protein [Gemmataceae bacterium]MDW8242718.1 SpoVG family protein [Thermogemmata sp.]